MTDAKKQANKKWDQENMITLSVRVRKDVAEEFRAQAAAAGTTANAVMKKTIYDYIGREEA